MILLKEWFHAFIAHLFEWLALLVKFHSRHVSILRLLDFDFYFFHCLRYLNFVGIKSLWVEQLQTSSFL